MSRVAANDAVRTSRTVLSREEAYRFRVRFDQEGVPDLVTDESPPLGRGQGPNPSRLLAAAVGNCLAASLLFCLEKARISVEGIQAVVDTAIARNAEGRLRIARVDVNLAPELTAAGARTVRCLDLFESFCTVTESVRHGIEVNVSVTPVVMDPGAGKAVSG